MKKTYGLLGKDISYSLSPVMHNAAFKALKLDAKYEVFDTPEEKLDDFFARLRKGEISGCNVTVPYKEKALEFVSGRTSTVNAIGALNTVVREGGALKGHNTDYNGFLKALVGREEGDLNFNPENKSVFIFGAGGAARAIVYVLSKVLAAKKIIIADIDNRKAEKLAEGISQGEKEDVTIALAQDRGQYNDFISHSDLLINATPCGAKDGDDELFDYSYIPERLYVFDLVYAADTPLMKEARSRGAKAVGGLNMLLYQAARSFELWTGKTAPLPAMREALLNKL